MIPRTPSSLLEEIRVGSEGKKGIMKNGRGRTSLGLPQETFYTKKLS